MKSSPYIPSYDAYMLPIVERLRVHGGSMTIEEMVDDVASAMGLTDAQRNLEHGSTGQSEVGYRMAWARTYLKKAGLLENSARGVWRLTPKAAGVTQEEISGIPTQVQRKLHIERKEVGQYSTGVSVAQQLAPELGDLDETLTWMEQLLRCLQAIPPDAFERLCQRMLREKGFIKVEVTGRSGDGGIDGTGVLRVNLLSFHVLFQCKRWKGSVGAPVVRDFRGAMVGRADKGLIITTGSFTAEARREAVRDGAPAIDLVDGEALCELLKELRIGVSVRMVEEVTVDKQSLAGI